MSNSGAKLELLHPLLGRVLNLLHHVNGSSPINFFWPAMGNDLVRDGVLMGLMSKTHWAC